MRTYKNHDKTTGQPYDSIACYKDLWTEIWNRASLYDNQSIRYSVDLELTKRGYPKSEREKILKEKDARIKMLVGQNILREMEDYPDGKTNLFKVKEKILEEL